jgi:phosphohistidine phosphatase
MKHLILLRHAKSTWVNPDVDDFDRPLNKRGKRSAKVLGQWLRAQGWAPDAVFCSAARRTRETWEGLSLKGTPDLRRDLYHAAPETMLEVIRAAPAAAKTLLLIGHNPGIAALAHQLVAAAPDHSRFNDYPTGSLLIADFDVKKPAKIAPGRGVVRSFVTPHDLTEPEA